MLFELSGWLAENYARGFSVFEYITLRAVLACATSLLIGLLAGPWVIRKLTALKIGQAVRSYGPETHLVKTGTPTMGGALILIAIAVSTLLWADLRNRYVWVVLLVTLGFGLVGWVDDYRQVVHCDPEGMPARQKFFWQALIGAAAASCEGLSSATCSWPAARRPGWTRNLSPAAAPGLTVSDMPLTRNGSAAVPLPVIATALPLAGSVSDQLLPL